MKFKTQNELISKLPDELTNIIYFNTIGLLYKKHLGKVLDELTFKTTTIVNMLGYIFLNLTHSISELDGIDYTYTSVERIPLLE